MRFLFHKTELYGHWFEDDEKPEEFTEKIPPHTGVIFNEELSDWVPKPREVHNETESETISEAPGEKSE
jgi:hypothetical protein